MKKPSKPDNNTCPPDDDPRWQRAPEGTDPREWLKPFTPEPLRVRIMGVQPDELEEQADMLREHGKDALDTLLRQRLLNPDVVRGRKLDPHRAGHANTGNRESQYAAEHPIWEKALADERREHPQLMSSKYVGVIKKRTDTNASSVTIRTFLRTLDAENKDKRA